MQEILEGNPAYSDVYLSLEHGMPTLKVSRKLSRPHAYLELGGTQSKAERRGAPPHEIGSRQP